LALLLEVMERALIIDAVDLFLGTALAVAVVAVSAVA
jgi:hypothetical protein